LYLKGIFFRTGDLLLEIFGMMGAMTVRWIFIVGLGIGACSKTDPPGSSAVEHACEGEGALADCLVAGFEPDFYVEQAHLYFNTMDTAEDMEVGPSYSELIARWEWPPWLLLTAFGLENIESADTLLRLYPSTIPQRDCRFFEQQPFARCRVTFYYEDAAHAGRGCPIYEEFAFNDRGEMTFIEAWSDLDGFRPMADDDPWAEADDVARLSTRIPGLGNSEGLMDLDGSAMAASAAIDADVADFVYRANHWFEAWSAEVEASGDDLWERGCGW
jgi:hypothetical protein